MLVEGKELGRVVHPLIQGRQVSTFEHDLIYNAGLTVENPVLSLQTLTLLTWLRHIASSSAQQFDNPFWLSSNLRHVLDGSETALL